MTINLNEKYYDQLERHLTSLGVSTNREELKSVFQPKLLKAGEHFIVQGEQEKKVAFVCEGYLRYYYITFDGEDVTKFFSFENTFVSSYASMVYKKPTAYNIVAEEDCVLLTIDHLTYWEKVQNSREWERVARIYTEYIYNLKEIREADLLLKDAKQRYEDFLIEFSSHISRIKQKHIATFLGIHPVTLSRIKKELKS